MGDRGFLGSEVTGERGTSIINLGQVEVVRTESRTGASTTRRGSPTKGVYLFVW